jgi:hypothetical protein
MSGSKNIFAPAAVACALVVTVVPSSADAKKKPDCTEFKPDLTVSATKESAASAEAKNAMIGAKGSTESASAQEKKELSDEEVAAQTKVYNACVAFQKDLINDATWQAAFLAYQGIDAPVRQQPAQQPAQQQPVQQAGSTTQPVVIVTPPTSAATSNTPAQSSGGGSGMGKVVLWTVIGVVAVATVIILVARSGGSDDGGDGGTTGTTGTTIAY